jgi:hypothetical protein
VIEGGGRKYYKRKEGTITKESRPDFTDHRDRWGRKKIIQKEGRMD